MTFTGARYSRQLLVPFCSNQTTFFVEKEKNPFTIHSAPDEASSLVQSFEQLSLFFFSPATCRTLFSFVDLFHLPFPRPLDSFFLERAWGGDSLRWVAFLMSLLLQRSACSRPRYASIFFLLLILVESNERKPEGNPRFLRKVTSCFCCEVHQRSGLSKEHQRSSRQKMTFFLWLGRLLQFLKLSRFLKVFTLKQRDAKKDARSEANESKKNLLHDALCPSLSTRNTSSLFLLVQESIVCTTKDDENTFAEFL